MATRVCQFLAIVLTALALVPTGAHLLELPAKIEMPEEPYFVVQQIYWGWALAGGVIFAAIFANIASAFAARRNPLQFFLSLAAGLLIAATLAIFFTWTYPANQATGNWTSAPADWERLRMEWEYSHAVNALIMFVALLSSVGSALSYRLPAESASRHAPMHDATRRDARGCDTTEHARSATHHTG